VFVCVCICEAHSRIVFFQQKKNNTESTKAPARGWLIEWNEMIMNEWCTVKNKTGDFCETNVFWLQHTISMVTIKFYAIVEGGK
jgi:hypothetical protein